MDGAEHKHSVQSRLLALTAAICFYYYSDARVDGFSFFGTSIKFGNSGAIIEFAWMLWLYYYLRTYQYYKDIGVPSYSLAFKSLLIDDLKSRMTSAEKDALRVFQEREGDKPLAVTIATSLSENYLRHYRGRPNRLVRIATLPAVLLQRILRGRSSRTRQLSYINLIREDRFKNIRHWLTFSPLVGPIKLRAIIYPERNLEYMDGGERIEIHIPWYKLYILLRIIVRSIMFRPSFWENYGPLVLGLTPVWYQIYRNIEKIHTLSAIKL